MCVQEKGAGKCHWFFFVHISLKSVFCFPKSVHFLYEGKRRWKPILILAFYISLKSVFGFAQAWAACVQEKEVESVPESTSRVSLQVSRSNVSIKSFFGQFLFSLSLSGLLCHFHLAITQIRFRNQISMRSFWNMGRLCFLLSTKQKIPKKCL